MKSAFFGLKYKLIAAPSLSLTVLMKCGDVIIFTLCMIEAIPEHQHFSHPYAFLLVLLIKSGPYSKILVA